MDREKAKNILARVVGGATHPSYTDIREACHYALDVLNEPSLPSDVDGAAEKAYPSSTWRDGKIAEHMTNLHCQKAFKAGAEWREKQIPKLPDSLDEAAENYIAPIENDEGLDYINFNGRDIKDAFKAGAEWGEKSAYKAIMKKADEVRDKRFDTDYEVKFEPSAGFDLGCVNVYHEGKLVGQYVELKKEKKLPEGLDDAAMESLPEEYDFLETDIYGGSMAVYSREQMIAMFKAGAEWRNTQIPKLPDNLDEAAEKHVKDKYGLKLLGVEMMEAADDFKAGVEWAIEQVTDILENKLNEASEKYRRDSYNKSFLPYMDGPDLEHGGSIGDAFKAGAKWIIDEILNNK